jgi:hypothetical protein
MGQGDLINIMNLMSSYTPGIDPLNAFVQLVNDGLGNDLLQVDRDGAGGTFGFQTVAKFNGVTNLDATTLVSSGNLVVH